MDNSLYNIRIQIASYEDKLLDLINERINLGIKVCQIKYNYLKHDLQIDFTNNTCINDAITNKTIEEEIIERIKQKSNDPVLSKIMFELYRDYIIPKTKELQVKTLKEIHLYDDNLSIDNVD